MSRKGRTTRRLLGELRQAIADEASCERALGHARARTAAVLLRMGARGTSSVFIAHAMISARGLVPTRALVESTRVATRKRLERARRRPSLGIEVEIEPGKEEPSAGTEGS